jgi:hypothetical protein
MAASSPAAKKARVVEPKSFGEIDVEAATLKVVDGKKDKYYVPLVDDETIRVILTPDEPAKLVLGFDMTGTYEQRSFNSAAVKPASGNESLGIRVELGDAQVEFLERLEAKFKALFPADGPFEWSSLVVSSDKYSKSSVKVNVCLSGDESSLTLLGFIKDGEVERGHGWEFLKANAEAESSGRYAFAGAEMKVVAKVRAWSMLDKEGKVRKGLSLAATQLFIKPRERIIIQEADVLKPW